MAPAEKCDICGRLAECDLVFDFEGEPLIVCPQCKKKFEREGDD